MDKNNLPQNGLPKELQNIPLGQIFILTNPAMGIRPKNIYVMEFIYSMAKKYNQEYIVYATPVFYSGLWDSCICKIKTDKEMHLLISDKDSLIEMLCEFWGLDYEEVCKADVNAGRYNKITYSGENHPVRIDITPKSKSTSMMDDSSDIATFQCLQDHSRDISLNRIDNIFNEIFSYGFDISWQEIKDRFDIAKENVRSYRLDIRIEKNTVLQNKRQIQKMSKCEIYLIDNFGKEYHIDLTAECKAIYLTYMLFKDGLTYIDIKYSRDFHDFYRQIYKQIPTAIGSPRTSWDLELKEVMDVFSNFISKIRKTILKVTNDIHCKEIFAVEGYKKDAFKVAGATDEIRDIIRKEFGIN